MSTTQHARRPAPSPKPAAQVGGGVLAPASSDADGEEADGPAADAPVIGHGDPSRLVTLLHVMAGLLSGAHHLAERPPIATTFLTVRELEEWATLVVEDESRPDKPYWPWDRRHVFEGELVSTTTDRARREVRRVLRPLCPDDAQREALGRRLHAICRDGWFRRVAPGEAAVLVVQALCDTLAPAAGPAT